LSLTEIAEDNLAIPSVP